MSKYVIEASVAVKWVFDEIQHIEARRYLNKTFNLIAPSCLLVECASAIQNKVRNGEIEPVTGWKSFEAIRDYEALSLVSTYDLIYRSYDLANEI